MLCDDIIGSNAIVNSKQQTIKNFLISLHSYRERLNGLTYLARQFSFARNYPALAVVVEELENYSEPAGLYFESLAKMRQGETQKATAIKIFQQLSDSDNPVVQAASLIPLALDCYQRGETDSAQSLISQAIKESADQPITQISAKAYQSLFLSLEGNRQESLDVLRAIHPAVVHWGRVYPALLAHQYNNIAYELACDGQFDGASQIIKGVLELPIAKAYPEWQETATEIALLRAARPSRCQVAITHHALFSHLKLVPKSDTIVPVVSESATMPIQQMRVNIFQSLIHLKYENAATLEIFWLEDDIEHWQDGFELPKQLYHPGLVDLLMQLEALRHPAVDCITIQIVVAANGKGVVVNSVPMPFSSLSRVNRVIENAKARLDNGVAVSNAPGRVTTIFGVPKKEEESGFQIITNEP